MFNNRLCVFLKQIPGRRSINIIVQNDFCDFSKRFRLHTLKSRTQFQRVTVFAVNESNRLFAGIHKSINVSLGFSSFSSDIGITGEHLTILLIESAQELFVIIEKIPLFVFAPPPVNEHAIRIAFEIFHIILEHFLGFLCAIAARDDK